MKKSFLVRNGQLLVMMLFMACSANAADLTTWQPTTAAGGAPVAPGYWDQQASYQLFGGGPTQNNNSLAVTQMDKVGSITTTTNVDYSANTSNTSSGSQTNHTSVTRDSSTMATNTSTGAQVNYTPITQDNSAMDITASTTSNK